MRDDISALLSALSEPLVEELHQESYLRQRVFSSEFIPRCNVHVETNGFVEISVEVPGFSRESLDVSVSNGVLTITGRSAAEPRPNGSLMRCERAGGAFSRRFRVSPNTQESDITAWHEDGLLTLRIAPCPGLPTHRNSMSLEEVTNKANAPHTFTVGDLQRANTRIERDPLSNRVSPPKAAPSALAGPNSLLSSIEDSLIALDRGGAGGQKRSRCFNRDASDESSSSSSSSVRFEKRHRSGSSSGGGSGGGSGRGGSGGSGGGSSAGGSDILARLVEVDGSSSSSSEPQ